MNELINVVIKNQNGKLLVSSREIAKGLEKEHKHVLSKIKEILDQSEFWPVKYLDKKGEERPEYFLDKDAFVLLVMNYTGYNDFKRAYIKRFNEMEKELLCEKIPKSYSEALRAFANEVEEKELIKKQRDEAILTKTWISDKKIATALNTASQRSKELKKLQTRLDRSKEFASVKAVEIATKNKFDWRILRNYCTSGELEMQRAFDSNYGSVRTYPAKAWLEIYEIDLKKLF
jgi:Rha family phage regulatory protein